MSGPGVDLSPTSILPGHNKDKFGRENPSVLLIMYNLEIPLNTASDKAHYNTNGAIVYSFIKPIASTMFILPSYYMDVTGPSIAVTVPNSEFFNSAVGIWIDGKLIWMLKTN